MTRSIKTFVIEISFPVLTLSKGLARFGSGDPISLFGVAFWRLYESAEPCESGSCSPPFSCPDSTMGVEEHNSGPEVGNESAELSV